ncbi:zinc ribbon domain-containing protein [Streptomyces sp. NPDC094472]|uniref:zinc ribbon domain-containing protein n=1 Tax=unclassified Streptomyces TaxID=2593676 RepID=UPI003320E277
MHFTAAVLTCHSRDHGVPSPPGARLSGFLRTGAGRHIVFHAPIETADGAAVERDGPNAVAPVALDCRDPMPHRGVWEGELYFQRCSWCQTAVFRRLLCPVCASTDCVWERSGGVGVIHHVLVMGRSIRRPWGIAIIGMREEFSLRCKVLGARALHVGTMVRLAAGLESDSQGLVFRLCDSADVSNGALC